MSRLEIFRLAQLAKPSQARKKRKSEQEDPHCKKSGPKAALFQQGLTTDAARTDNYFRLSTAIFSLCCILLPLPTGGKSLAPDLTPVFTTRLLVFLILANFSLWFEGTGVKPALTPVFTVKLLDFLSIAVFSL